MTVAEGTGVLADLLNYPGKKPCWGYKSGELDKGIEVVVRTLQENGIRTYESCEGGEGHAYPYPAVRFEGLYGDGFKALAIALEHMWPVRRINRIWQIEFGELVGPVWEIEFFRPILKPSHT